MQSTAENEIANQGWAAFLAQINELKDAVSVGDLKRRLVADGDSSEVDSACHAINQIMDTITLTFDRAVTSVDGMSIGRIPPPFEDGFPGDFRRARNVCNHFIDVINRRNIQIAKMTEAAARGDLHVRANVEEFTGANRRIFEGFNSMFDAWLAPVAEIERVLTALAQMDLTARVDGHYDGEYQRIATLLNTVCLKLTKEVQEIMQHTTVMASTSGELTAITKELSRGADETSRMAASAAKTSETVSEGLSAVAAGSGEMLSSIREISANTGNASTVVQTAVTAAESTTQRISDLGRSSEQISKIIKTITRIAQQTNLLALNATIEAARAGEAGKGFAVVATEVKELAKETAKATDEVSKSIEDIQRNTRESIAAIAGIATVTREISGITQTIRDSVEGQAATTNEMGRFVSDAAQTASAIAKEMGGLAEAARGTSASATRTDSSIAELNKILAQLKTFVALFKI